MGNAHDTGQDGTAGRRPPRHLLPDTGGPEPRKPPARRGRAPKANADTRPRWRALSRGVDAELWLAGWQALKKEAARGVAPVPADADAANLQGPIAALGQRVTTKRARATLVRRWAIPHANGPERP